MCYALYYANKYEFEINELDFDEVIDLIDPKIGKKIKVATGIVGLFTNKTTDELFDDLGGIEADGLMERLIALYNDAIRSTNVGADGEVKNARYALEL